MLITLLSLHKKVFKFNVLRDVLKCDFFANDAKIFRQC